MKEIPDGSVDLVLTDPPYGTTASSWDRIINFGDMWNQLGRVLSMGSCSLIFASQKRISDAESQIRRAVVY